MSVVISGTYTAPGGHGDGHDSSLFRVFYALYFDQFCSILGVHPLILCRLLMQKSGGGFLVKEEICLAQCGHNDFFHTPKTEPGFFIMEIGANEFK